MGSGLPKTKLMCSRAPLHALQRSSGSFLKFKKIAMGIVWAPGLQRLPLWGPHSKCEISFIFRQLVSMGIPILWHKRRSISIEYNQIIADWNSSHAKKCGKPSKFWYVLHITAVIVCLKIKFCRNGNCKSIVCCMYMVSAHR